MDTPDLFQKQGWFRVFLILCFIIHFSSYILGTTNMDIKIGTCVFFLILTIPLSTIQASSITKEEIRKICSVYKGQQDKEDCLYEFLEQERKEAENNLSPKEQVFKNIKLEFHASITTMSTMNVNFVISNNSGYKIKDIEVTCESFGNSGTLIDKNTRTIYELFPAYSVKNVHNFNMGFINSQTKKIYCAVNEFILIK